MICLHYVFKECLIDQESQGFTLECIYCAYEIITGNHMFRPNNIIMKTLFVREKSQLYKQMHKKIDGAQVNMQYASSQVTM